MCPRSRERSSQLSPRQSYFSVRALRLMAVAGMVSLWLFCRSKQKSHMYPRIKSVCHSVIRTIPGHRLKSMLLPSVLLTAFLQIDAEAFGHAIESAAVYAEN